jgi:hypothetical protein
MGKLHRERAVIGKIFQALPTQTDNTTVAFIYKISYMGSTYPSSLSLKSM